MNKTKKKKEKKKKKKKKKKMKMKKKKKQTFAGQFSENGGEDLIPCAIVEGLDGLHLNELALIVQAEAVLEARVHCVVQLHQFVARYEKETTRHSKQEIQGNKKYRS
jgi:hypothetical protein